MDITAHIVRDINGIIDQVATLEKVKSLLVTKAEQESKQIARLNAAIHAVFDNYGSNTRIPMPALCSGVAMELKYHPSMFNQLKAEIESFIRSSSYVFNISRGRNGGVLRMRKPE